MNMIKAFVDKYRFLSNFFPSPIIWNGQRWETAEHLYQAMKTVNKNDRELIRLASTPGKTKKLGQQVELRSDWENAKHRTMKEILELKFKQNPELAQKLINTKGMILEEGNFWHDNYWGICRCKRCKHKTRQNHLGLLLMELRKEISK